jgi:TetR/AcrR family fatty acid metabolism transcriptional regulator
VQRTQEVLEAAIKVFARMGFHKARMDDIAQEASVSKGVLYFYFKSKDAIIEALLKQIFSRSLHMQELMQTEGSVRDHLLELTDTFGREVQIMKLLLPVAFEFYSLAGRNKTVNEFVGNYYRELIDSLSKLIEQGITKGELQSDLDTIQTARTIISIFEGMTLLWILEKAKFDWTDNARTAITHFIQGIERHPGQT